MTAGTATYRVVTVSDGPSVLKQAEAEEPDLYVLDIMMPGLDGREVTRAAKGFHARVIQHEVDHLEGILYPQRMKDLKNLIFEYQIWKGERRETMWEP